MIVLLRALLVQATSPFPPPGFHAKGKGMAKLPPELDELSRRFDALRGAL